MRKFILLCAMVVGIMCLLVLGVWRGVFHHDDHESKAKVQEVGESMPRVDSIVSSDPGFSDDHHGSHPADSPVRVENQSGSLRVILTGEIPAIISGKLVLYRLEDGARSKIESRGIYGLELFDCGKVIEIEITDAAPVDFHNLDLGDYALHQLLKGCIQNIQPITLHGPEELVQIPVRRSLGVKGKVLNGNNSPQPNVEIRMASVARAIDPDQSFADRLTTCALLASESTDEAGEFVFSESLPSPMRLHIVPTRGFGEWIIWDVEDGSEHRINLLPSAAIRGNVSSESGPVKGARVTVYRKDADGYEVPVCSTESDPDGDYLIESIPAGLGPLAVYSECPGFEMRRQSIPAMAEGAMREINFQVAKGIEARIRLLTDDGVPISDAHVRLQSNLSSVVPFSYLTDATGRFSTGPHVVCGNTYRIILYSGGISSSIAVVTLTSDAIREQVVVVNDLSRISLASSATAEGVDLIELEAHLSRPTMVFQWRAPFPPAWLPCGLFQVSAFKGSTLYSQVLERIAPGNDHIVELQSIVKGNVHFEIGPSDDIATVMIYSTANVAVWSETEPSGEYTVELPPGSYYFSIGTGTQDWIDSRPFMHSLEDQDLGQLMSNFTEVGNISGAVLDAYGKPLPGAGIHLASSSGYRSASTTTDEAGGFSLLYVPVGIYRLVCELPSSNDQEFHSIEREVVLLQGGEELRVLLRPSLEDRVTVHLPPMAARVERAFAVTPRESHWTAITVAGDYWLEAPTEGTVTGVAFIDNEGAIRVLTGVTTRGSPELNILEDAAVESRIQFTARNSTIAPDTAEFYLDGSLVGRFSLRASDQLRVTHMRAGRHEVRLFRGGMLIGVCSLSPNGGDIAWMARDDIEAINFDFGSARFPKPVNIAVICCGILHCSTTTTRIVPICGLLSHQIRIDSSFACMVESVVRSGSTIQVLPESKLRLIRLSPSFASIASRMTLHNRTGAVELDVMGVSNLNVSEIPCGDVKIAVYDQSGVLLAREVAILGVEGPQELLLDEIQ